MTSSSKGAKARQEQEQEQGTGHGLGHQTDVLMRRQVANKTNIRGEDKSESVDDVFGSMQPRE